MNCPEPRDRAEGDFETAGPVDAELRRVGVHPRFEVGDADARVTFVAGEPVSLAQGLEVLMAIQLTDDLFIAGDKKIIWELNRHQHFQTLGQAYWLTGDERYARVCVAHLEAWMDANPPKLGINWTSSLEAAFRSISWLWAVHFFKSSPSLTPEVFKRAWKFLYLSARHLESYLSTYFSPNTHLTGEALGLFYIGTMMPEFKEAKRWQELGSRILVEQLPIHVKSDGVYFEQSSYYHRYTTDFYLHFLLLARANQLELPPQVEEALVLLLVPLMYIM